MNKRIFAMITLVAALLANTYLWSENQVKAAYEIFIEKDNTKVTRITGKNQFEVATAVSQAGWTTSDNVILASTVDFADALSGTSLGIVLDAPILYAYGTNLNEFTANEIKRLNAKKVYLLGGTGSISKEIEDILKQQGLEVVRIAGSDRFETSVLVGNEVINKSKSTTAYLSNAYGYADALSAASFTNGDPMILTNKDSLSYKTKNAIKEWGIKKIYILGGTGVVSQSIEDELSNMGITTERYGGANRYETSTKIINELSKDRTKYTVVTGMYFWNALASSVYAHKTSHPALLMDYRNAGDIAMYLSGKDVIAIGISDDEYESYDAVTSFYKKEEEKVIRDNPTPDNPNDWVCPQITESAPLDVSEGFKILGRDLGFGYTRGWACFSPSITAPTNASNIVMSVTLPVVHSYASWAYITIDSWDYDPNIKGSYKIQPIAQQLFKFYFPTQYMEVFNHVNNGDVNLGEIYTFDNREVIFSSPLGTQLTIYMSAPGEHLSKDFNATR